MSAATAREMMLPGTQNRSGFGTPRSGSLTQRGDAAKENKGSEVQSEVMESLKSSSMRSVGDKRMSSIRKVPEGRWGKPNKKLASKAGDTVTLRNPLPIPGIKSPQFFIGTTVF